MGDFMQIARQVAARLNEGPGGIGTGPIQPDQVGDLVRRSGVTATFNCYPGIPEGACHSLAVFVSLNSVRSKGNTRGHLPFKDLFPRVWKHLAQCPGTRQVVIVTDTWEVGRVDPFLGDLARLKQTAHVEAFLIHGGNVAEIPL
ncbi:MAG: hypothetical protein GX442_21255 [Candidatus Riflebacteria bacterium]|nr:hypothetical protein [Candidatus Riflebacteria bacterium]